MSKLINLTLTQVFKSVHFPNCELSNFHISLRGKIKQLDKIKVGIVNYLNTKPLLFGINHSPVRERIVLVEDYPSNIASHLMQGKIDIGLVPVAILPKLSEFYIHTDYCIGCDGQVGSVCLFSDVPLEEVETVLLDYQSRTSVALLKILVKHFWKINPQYLDTSSDYRSGIRGTTAGLVIGDRSFEQRKNSRYVYDLGEAWKQFTGLPFVFAAWISPKPLAKNFVTEFNSANAFGVANIDRLAETVVNPLIDVREYFTRCISYHLNDAKKQGLQRFLQFLTSQHSDGGEFDANVQSSSTPATPAPGASR